MSKKCDLSLFSEGSEGSSSNNQSQARHSILLDHQMTYRAFLFLKIMTINPISNIQVRIIISIVSQCDTNIIISIVSQYVRNINFMKNLT